MTSTSPHRELIRVGVVGLSASGGWAATAHVPALAGLDGYELRALSAGSAESARAAGEKYAVPLAFASAEELARSDEVVAHEYALLRDQIIGSLAPDEDGVPDFRHAVRRHAMLERVREAARAGRKVTLAEQGA
ncbi:Gfo/Idh/MocA family oxidoreductase [Streptomyces mirabilis]|uniref:hypothetical protein n=1 Tax=Streptomyces mirabilis TaxID=68239 RepID=UPI0036B72E47